MWPGRGGTCSASAVAGGGGVWPVFQGAGSWIVGFGSLSCCRDSKVPEPPVGHRWKEVRCDRTVTWLAAWTENVQNSIKYIMLNPSSKLKVSRL